MIRANVASLDFNNLDGRSRVGGCVSVRQRSPTCHRVTVLHTLMAGGAADDLEKEYVGRTHTGAPLVPPVGVYFPIISRGLALASTSRQNFRHAAYSPGLIRDRSSFKWVRTVTLAPTVSTVCW